MDFDKRDTNVKQTCNKYFYLLLQVKMYQVIKNSILISQVSGKW